VPRLPLNVSTELAALIDTSTPEFGRLAQQLAAVGVTHLGISGGTSDKPEQVTCHGPRYRGKAKVGWTQNDPVKAALEGIAEELRSADQYVRFRLAASDMENVSNAARTLAAYRHEIGTPGSVGHNPLANVAGVIEVGLVVAYARSFTGKARLGDRWRPAAGPDRALHDALVAARDAIHAHADHTAYRSVVDLEHAQGATFPAPTPAFAETRMSAETLGNVATLCDRQRERFELEAKRLYGLFRGPPALEPEIEI
jgi:hypothetical protein